MAVNEIQNYHAKLDLLNSKGNGKSDQFVAEVILLGIFEQFSCKIKIKGTNRELIYACKMIQPGIFFRFSQPVYFSRLLPKNLAVLKADFFALCTASFFLPGKLVKKSNLFWHEFTK